MEPRQFSIHLLGIFLLSCVNFVVENLEQPKTYISVSRGKRDTIYCPHQLENASTVGWYNASEERCYEVLALRSFQFNNFYFGSKIMCMLMGGRIFSFTGSIQKMQNLLNTSQPNFLSRGTEQLEATFLTGTRLSYVSASLENRYIRVTVEYLVPKSDVPLRVTYRVYNNSHWKVEEGTCIGIAPEFFMQLKLMWRKKLHDDDGGAETFWERTFSPTNCIVSELQSNSSPKYELIPCDADPEPAGVICRVKRLKNCDGSHYSRRLKITTCKTCSSGDLPFCHHFNFSKEERHDHLCALIDCGKYGTCIISGKFPACKCNESIATGLTCENIAESVLCSELKCINKGVCIKTDYNTAQCVCPTGFAGETCAEDVNECQYNPCGEFGTCLNTFGSYVCMCADGKTGKLCRNTDGQGHMKAKAHERAVYGSIGGMLMFIVLSIMAIIYQWRKKKMELARQRKTLKVSALPGSPSKESISPQMEKGKTST